MPKLATIRSLSFHELATWAEATVALALAQIRIAHVPPRNWRNILAAQQPQIVQPSNDRDLKTTIGVRIAVKRAARNLPSAPNCLPQALAARTMLDRRGIATTLHIGASRDRVASERFHAWLKYGDLFVTGDCDEAHYAQFSTPERMTAESPCEARDSLASHRTE